MTVFLSQKMAAMQGKTMPHCVIMAVL